MMYCEGAKPVDVWIEDEWDNEWENELIRRGAVMDALGAEYNRRAENGGLKLAWIEKAVNSVVPVQSLPEWTPVTIAMPPADEIVLVTCQPKHGQANVNRAYWSDGSWHGSGSMSTVTAWMKMPEPYTEASDAEVH